MPAQMSPEEMSAMQQQAGKDSSGGVTKLAQQVGQGLSQLSDMLDSSQGATDADKAQMQQILSLFVDLVEKKLGGTEPGQDAAPDGGEMSQVPADAGRSGQPMGPQSRN